MGEKLEIAAKTQSGYINWVARHLSQVNTFVEIGPDVGLVTREVIRTFQPKKVTLVEPNRLIRDELKKNAAGVKQIQIVDQLSDVEINNIDLAIGVHVYDHLLEPLGHLSQVRQISGSHSNLMIVVHDEKSILRKILRNNWPPFCLQHPQLFNKRTLNLILKSAGWELQYQSKSVNWQQVHVFAAKAATILGLGNSWTRFLPPVEFPFPLGNRIALARPSTPLY